MSLNSSKDIFRGFLNDSNSLIADPFLLYRGKIESFEIQEGEKDSAVGLSIVSHWADFEKSKVGMSLLKNEIDKQKNNTH